MNQRDVLDWLAGLGGRIRPACGGGKRVVLSNPQLRDVDLQRLQELQHVTGLDLCRSTIGNRTLEVTSELDDLVELSLACTQVEEWGLLWLLGNERLRNLDLTLMNHPEHRGQESRRMELTEMAYVASCKGLRFLGLGSCIDDRHMPFLTALPHLRYLNLPLTGVTDCGLEVLEGHATLKSLNLFGCAVSDDALKCLKTVSSLECIRLDNTRVGNSGVAVLAEMWHLRRVFLAGTCITDRALQYLAAMPLLEYLDLSNTSEVTMAALQWLRKQLPVTQIRG